MTYQQLLNAMEKAKDFQENLNIHIELLSNATSKTQTSTLLSIIEYYKKELRKEISE